MKYNKGFAPLVVLLIVLGVLAVGGVAYFAGKSSAPKNEVADNFPQTEQNYTPPTTNNNPPQQQTPPPASNPPVVNNQTQSLVNCSHNKLGISFDYPKGFSYGQEQGRPSCVFIVPDEFGTVDAGKMIAGYIASSSNFTMFVGGSTKNISFPGELNAADVQSYPDANQIKSWNDRGYKTEKKINKNNQEYILVHGQHEVDMPYLSENQLLAVFKLKSSKDFPAIGFQLVGGNLAVFNQIIDSIKIY